MKIKFTGKYKSLSTFQSEELSNLTVITGKNGTGKSQLIHCINPPKPDGFELLFEPSFSRIQISNLIYQSSGPATHNTIRTRLDKHYSNFMSLRPQSLVLYSILMANDISLKDFIKFNKEEISSLLNLANLKAFVVTLLSERSYGGQQSLPEDVIINNLKASLKSDFDIFEILQTVKNYTNKKIEDIDRNDFSRTPLPDKFIDESDMFQSQIETIFFNYLKRKHDNQYLAFRNEKFKESNIIISDTDFEKMFPAPWAVINNILSDNNINLRVIEYNTSEYSEDIAINVRFKKEGINEFVFFDSLSSGEQIIIGLILKLFTGKYYESELKFPELIVLDEPDANLHPEMSKLLIDVLYRSFVQELGMKVIMTTHSPSTVALAPEGSIFEMSNTPSCSIKKVSKDYALELLTGMIPTLSIDYKNHKQVFVESPTDVLYFRRLYNKLSENQKLNYKLYFISNNKGGGNCTWVNEIVSKLREGGVKRSFGIIDWDLNNKSSECVIVHGENRRYSIENFILDPVYLSILFLEMNGADGIAKDLNIDETYNFYNLYSEPEKKLQIFTDWVVDKIENKFPALKSDLKEDIVYHNEKKITVPSWLLKQRGHDIEQKLRKTFLSLSKFTSEGELQDELSKIMAKCFPLVPKESVDLLMNLCL